MIEQKRLVVAWDVDDTLLIPAVAIGDGTGGKDMPNHKNIQVLRWFSLQGHHVIVWSGGGVPYANMWVDRLGIRKHVDEVIIKEKNPQVDICFDDCDVDLATVNIKVKRLNNSQSREEWNKHEIDPEGNRITE